MLRVVITPDSKYFISGSADGTIKITNTHTKELVHHFQGASLEYVNCLALTSDGRFLVAGCAKSIKIYDIEARQEIYHFNQAHESTRKNYNEQKKLTQK